MYDIYEPGPLYFSLDAKENPFIQDEIYNNKSSYVFAPHIFTKDMKTPH